MSGIYLKLTLVDGTEAIKKYANLPNDDPLIMPLSTVSLRL